MNNRIGEHELLVLLTGLFISQLLIPGSLAPVDYAANAAWVSVLLSMVLGLGFALISVWLLQGGDYFSACDLLGRASGLFSGLLGLLFLVLTAVCFRGLLDTLEAYILSLTPRALLAGLLLLCLLPGCFFGSAPISRMLSFYAPFASLLFLAVLLLALPHNAKLTNLFPLFGDGARRLAIDGSIGAVSYLWLFVLLIERRRCKRPLRTGLLSVALSALFLFVGYLSYSLLNAPGSPSETSAPLQQITTFSGYWRFFQRTQSVFVFAWAPLLLCASAAGLCYCGRCLGHAFGMEDPRPLFLPLGVVLLCLAAPSTERAPVWLRFVIEQKAWRALSLPPLLAPLIAWSLHQRKARRQTHA